MSAPRSVDQDSLGAWEPQNPRRFALETVA